MIDRHAVTLIFYVPLAVVVKTISFKIENENSFPVSN